MADQYFSTARRVGNGSRIVWDFSFAGARPAAQNGTQSYLEADDVKVALSTTDQYGTEVRTPVPFILGPGAAQVTITPAIPEGQDFVIYRDTEIEFPLVDFTDFAAISENDLDVSYRQGLFLAQESRDFNQDTRTLAAQAAQDTAVALDVITELLGEGGEGSLNELVRKSELSQEPLEGGGASLVRGAVIYVDSLEQAEALPNLQEGQEVNALGTVLKVKDGVFYPVTPVNVKIFGATGDGVSDDFPAFKEAVNWLPEGASLLIPDGVYVNQNRGFLTNIDSWIILEKSGVSFLGKGSATLVDFLILVRGEAGELIPVGDGFDEAARDINTATPHGLSASDYVQLLSVTNPYTPDAGHWQGGSENPTTNVTTQARFSEIHRVGQILSSTEARLNSLVIYNGYRPNTSGMSFPIPGVTTAQVRRLEPVIKTKFEHINFVTTYNNFRCVSLKTTANTTFIGCQFNGGTNPGRHIHTEDSLGLKFVLCKGYRSPEGASGSSWNSIILGGGTQNVSFENCNMYGGWQQIDMTPLQDNLYLFGGEREEVTSFLTAQYLTISNSRFLHCSDGVTTHPTAMGLTVKGSTFYGCSTAARVRGRKNAISGNQMHTTRGGISFSAFMDDSVTTGNVITQLISPYASPGFWTGVSISVGGSETFNQNNTKGFLLANNSIDVADTDPNSRAIRVSLNEASKSLMTPAQLTAISDMLITDNQIRRGSVTVQEGINGLRLVGNEFSGVSHSSLGSLVHFGNNCARTTLKDNLFYSNSLPAVIMGNITSSYSYTTGPVLTGNAGVGLVPSVTQGTGYTKTGFFETGGDSKQSDRYSLVNGGSVQSYRDSGNTLLNIEAVPQDGSSASSVRLLFNSTTSGSKDVRVDGGLQSHNAFAAVDNTYSNGTAGRRWSQVFAANATINTSDSREKQQKRGYSQEERNVAKRLLLSGCAFKWNNAVITKGDSARWHYGWIAQDVIQAFEEEGLDAFARGFVCYDEWHEVPEEVDEETGVVIQEFTPAGNRYGLRMSQLNAFVLGAIGAKLAKLLEE